MIFKHIFGLDSATSTWYLFWSGIANNIIYVAAIGGWYKHHKCEYCWRFGRHQLKPPVCKKHYAIVD